MTDLKQAAQMALEALRYPLDTSAKLFDADKAELMNLRAINALRKALEEQPEKYTFGTPLLDLFKVSPGQIVHADVLAEPDSDYERGFVDGMNLQTKGSVDKAVNRMAQTTHWEGCEAVHPECEAAKAERKRICDMLLDMHAKEERHNYYLFIANIIKESA